MLAGRWRPQRWAVTWGQTTWWTVAEADVDPAWRRHEDCHKAQYARDGKLRFVCRYFWEWICGLMRYRSLAQAYVQISYEREAIAAESEVWQA